MLVKQSQESTHTSSPIESLPLAKSSLPTMTISSPVYMVQLNYDKNGNPDKMLEVAGVVHNIFIQTPKGIIHTQVFQPSYVVLTTSEDTQAGKVFSKLILGFDQRGNVDRMLAISVLAEQVFSEIPHEIDDNYKMPPAFPSFSASEAKRSSRVFNEKTQQSPSEEEPSRPQYSYTPPPRSNGEKARTERAEPSLPSDRDQASDESYGLLSKVLGKPVSKSSSDYEVLGLSPSASNDEIRSAYKKLSLKVHPDKAGVDTTISEGAFKMVSGAYNRLYDHNAPKAEQPARKEETQRQPKPEVKTPRQEETVSSNINEQHQESATILAIEAPPQIIEPTTSNNGSSTLDQPD